MGLISPQKIITRWNNRNKDWYISKGYKYTGYRDEVEVNAEDLPKNSSEKVKVACDDCGEEKTLSYTDYNRAIDKRANKKYYCIDCVRKHKIENTETSQLRITHPDLSKYLVNEEDGYKYSIHSKIALEFNCPFCGEIHKKLPKNLLGGIDSLCPTISSSVSFNNKFIYCLLKQTKLNFDREYYNKDWCHIFLNGEERKVIYDFIIWLNDRKIIIEADGGFHYTDNTLSNQSLEESSQIDALKDKLAIENGFEIYRINCNQSTYNQIHISIIEQMKKYLSDIIDFDKLDIDKILLESRKSTYQNIWDIYNSGETSIQKIVEISQKSKSFVIKALNIGDKLKQVNYITQYDTGAENNSKIIELWDNGEFDLDVICEKVGVSKPIICKYIQRKFEETQDPFYNTSSEVFLYSVEDDTYYSKEYINNFYQVKRAYQSIWQAIKRNGTYKKKHWKIVSRQEAYYQYKKNKVTGGIIL